MNVSWNILGGFTRHECFMEYFLPRVLFHANQNDFCLELNLRYHILYHLRNKMSKKA